ncbi:hypothetical protein IJ102_02925, partial [Candidatus Saccharibacteria bacterium]|nr:hypothetical protein [Candidatus Saccharibacteria bacterium]
LSWLERVTDNDEVCGSSPHIPTTALLEFAISAIFLLSLARKARSNEEITNLTNSSQGCLSIHLNDFSEQCRLARKARSNEELITDLTNSS